MLNAPSPSPSPRKTRPLILGLLASTMPSAAALSADIYVGNNIGDMSSIAAAFAVAGNGDNIIVRNGTWVANNISWADDLDDLSLVSLNGAALCEIRASTANRHFDISGGATGARIGAPGQGFTLTGGVESGSDKGGPYSLETIPISSSRTALGFTT